MSLDDFLLDRVFQPASEWLTDLTGSSCLWYGAHGLSACIALTLIGNGLDFHQDAERFGFIRGGTWVALVFALVWCAWLAATHRRVRSLDESYESGVITGMNPLRLEYLWLRVVFVFIATLRLALIPITNPYDARDMIGDIEAVMCAVTLHLIACTPRPPKRRTAPARYAFGGAT